MRVSTKGRYALRVMLDLAEQESGTYVPMKEVAARQEVSLKYLERILPALSKNKLIEGVQGKGGGYRLTRNPSQYTVGEILRLTEGDMAPVACLECNGGACERTAECKTRPMWSEFYRRANEYFDQVTLADLIKGEQQNGQ